MLQAPVARERQLRAAVTKLPARDWTEMSWPEIAGAGDSIRRWIAVLPLAAVEQHGPHLPLGVDVDIGEAYLAKARTLIPDALPVTFLPLQRIGVSVEHNAFTGTLSLSPQTAIAAWTEIGESLARAGLRKLVLITSHGGNSAVMEIVARELRARFGMLAVTVGWHRFGYPDGVFPAQEIAHGIHGGAVETSIMQAARPALVRADQIRNAVPASLDMAREFKWLNASRPAGFAWMSQDLNATGAIGDGTLASAAKGEAALAHGAQAFVELLREIDRFDLERLKAAPLHKLKSD